MPPGGAQDLLAVARLAGRDLYGTGLGLNRRDPLWGRYAVNVATLKPVPEGSGHQLVINLRRTPPLTAPQLKAKLEQWVAAFNKRTGAALVPGGYWEDEPLVFDPRGQAGQAPDWPPTRARPAPAPAPAISGGGTYAKRMPRSIAFGMWFPGKPVPRPRRGREGPHRRSPPRRPRADRGPGRPGLQPPVVGALQALMHVDGGLPVGQRSGASCA